jgi:hypothetical protein
MLDHPYSVYARLRATGPVAFAAVHARDCPEVVTGLALAGQDLCLPLDLKSTYAMACAARRIT